MRKVDDRITIKEYKRKDGTVVKEHKRNTPYVEGYQCGPFHLRF